MAFSWEKAKKAQLAQCIRRLKIYEKCGRNPEAHKLAEKIKRLKDGKT